MKALTLTQPWATLVAEGKKTLETRSWSTSYRGPLLIHAAKGFPGWAQELAQEEQPFSDALNRPNDEIPRGALLATTHLVECVSTDLYAPPENERPFGDYSSGRFVWVFGAVEAMQYPVPWKGALGLWECSFPKESSDED